MSGYFVSFPGLGIDNLEISPVAFTLFGFPIYWYGLLIAAAVLVCMFLALRDSKAFGLKQDDILDMLLLSVPLGIVCARLYFVIFEWSLYKDNLLKIFDTRSGGLAFYGGVIGGILGVALMSLFKKIPFHRVADFLIVYIPLGQAIGRWGNFFNQEAFGNNTGLPWGMISNRTRSYLASLGQSGINPDQPVHPTFLYEFLANLLIFFLLRRIRKQSKQKFETLSWYLILYGGVRFFVESIRTDALFIGQSNVRVSMLVSALMVLGAALYLGKLWLNDRRALRRAALGDPAAIAILGLDAEEAGSAGEGEKDADAAAFADITETITARAEGEAPRESGAEDEAEPESAAAAEDGADAAEDDAAGADEAAARGED